MQKQIEYDAVRFESGVGEDRMDGAGTAFEGRKAEGRRETSRKSQDRIALERRASELVRTPGFDPSVRSDAYLRARIAQAERGQLAARAQVERARTGKASPELRSDTARGGREARQRAQDARLDGATSKEDAVARYKRRIADQWRPQAKPQDPPAPARQDDDDDPVATARDAYHAAQREAWRKKG